ncbi:MAG: CHAT domain-containing protein [Cyanobacteria bacterium P01_B01_bin.77]
MRSSVVCLTTLTTALLLVDYLHPTDVSAQSIVPSAGGTGSIVDVDENRYTITGGMYSGDGGNLFHMLELLNLNTDESADFITESGTNNVLTLINGGNASFLDGLIQITGSDANLFLANPAGVLLGTNARLNLGGDLTVTTADRIGFGDNWLNIFDSNSDYASLIENPSAFAFTSSTPGVVVNEGNLALEAGQQLTLLGGTVINTGTLVSEDGIVTVAAVPGEQLVRLSQAGNLLNLEFAPIDGLNAAQNETTVPFNPLSLPEILTGNKTEHASEITVNPDGTIQLGSAGSTFSNNIGLNLLSGTISTIGNDGGAITALGDYVGLLDADLSASGINGGGTIRIGGDYQGQGPIPNAKETFVDSTSLITADALNTGNGGQIIIWADDNTAFYGTLSAQGGSNSGDGGFAEVSGKQNLLFLGSADLSSNHGDVGTLLLDPEDLIIADGNPDINNDDEFDFGNGTLPSTGVATISELVLEQISDNADITLQATNNITINDLGDDSLDLPITRSGDRIISDHKIAFIADSDGDGVGSFTMSPDDTIRTNGGNVSIQGNVLSLGGFDVTNLVLEASEIDFLGGPNSIVSGDGNRLVIRSNGLNQDVIVGGTDNTTAALDLTQTDLAAIEPGLSNLAIAAGNGELSIADNIIFTADLVTLSASTAGTTPSPIRQGTGTVTLQGITVEVPGLDIIADNGILIENTTLNSTNIRNNFTGNFDSTGGGSVRIINSTVNTVGELSISGEGNANLLDNDGIFISNSTLSTSRLLALGTSQGSGGSARGIVINNGSTVETIGGGNLTLEGFGSDVSSGVENHGVFISNSGSSNPLSIRTDGGDLLIEGTLGTGNTGRGVGGVRIQRAGTAEGGLTIETTNSGDLTILGSGRDNSTASSYGVYITDTATSSSASQFAIRTQDGQLLIRGQSGSGTGFNHDGIRIQGGTIEAVGSGAVDLIGIAGSGENISDGIEIFGGAILTTTTGNLTLLGTGDTTGPNVGNLGIRIVGATLEATLGGSIFLQGNSPGNPANGDGVRIVLNTSNGIGNVVRTIDGNINIQGYGSALSSGINIFGNATFDSLIEAIGTGSVSLIGTGGSGVFIQDNAVVQVENGDLLITGTGQSPNIERFGIDLSNSELNALGTGRIFLTATAPDDESIFNLAGTINAESLISASTAQDLLLPSFQVNGPLALSSTAGDIQTGDIKTNGNDLALQSPGAVVVGNIDTRSTINNSGSVAIEAFTEIQVGAINTSSLTGDAGNVFLDPIRDIEIASINATAPNGSGGIVDITAGRFFRATDSFTDFNSVDASISTADSLDGGSVTIRHGGADFVPFTIGDGDLNGTQAAITTGDNRISPTQSFLGPYIQENIQIITPPRLDATSQLAIPVDIDYVPIDIDKTPIISTSYEIVEPAYVTITYDDVEDIETVLDTVEEKFQEQYENYYKNSLEPEATDTNIPLPDEPNITQPNDRLESPTNSVPNEPSDIGITIPAPSSVNDSLPADSEVVTNPRITSPELPNANNPDDPSNAPNQLASDSQSSSPEDNSPEQTAEQNNNSTESSSDQTLTDTLNNAFGDNEFEETPASNNLEVSDNSEQTLVFDPVLGQHIIDSPQNQTTESDTAQGAVGAADGGTDENDSTVVDAQNTIRRIESQTGAKPAIIYAFFAPSDQLIKPVVPSDNPREDTIAQQFASKEEVLWAFNTDGSLPLLIGQSFNNQYGCDGREDHELFLVLVTSEEEVIAKHVPNANCTRVIKKARDFREKITLFEPDYLKDAQQLYEWLVRPLTTELQQNEINNLVFIMDQGLRATPLAALHDGQGFLVQNYSLGLMPSLNIANTQYQDIQNSSVLPAGISDFETANLSDLPAVPFEISNITDNWLGSADPLLDTEATRANLNNARSDSPYGIVHLATHAFFKRGNPEQSYIQLWGEQLKLSDIREMGWNSPAVELLILSACETAKDSYEAELGFAGFASQAGVKSTLASLWQVSDIGTAGLMIEFYTQLRSSENSIKAAALRQAQLAMLNGTVELSDDLLSWSGGNIPLFGEVRTALSQSSRTPELSHPFYWSGFTLVGSPW